MSPLRPIARWSSRSAHARRPTGSCACSSGSAACRAPQRSRSWPPASGWSSASARPRCGSASAAGAFASASTSWPGRTATAPSSRPRRACARTRNGRASPFAPTGSSSVLLGAHPPSLAARDRAFGVNARALPFAALILVTASGESPSSRSRTHSRSIRCSRSSRCASRSRSCARAFRPAASARSAEKASWRRRYSASCSPPATPCRRPGSNAQRFPPPVS